MNDFLAFISLFLVLALAAGVFTLAIYGYKRYLEPMLLAKAESNLEQKLQRVNALNNAQIAQIKQAAQIMVTQAQSIDISIDALDVGKVNIDDMSMMSQSLKELATLIEASSKRLGSKVPRPIASIISSNDPRKAGAALANRAGFYSNNGSNPTIEFFNAIKTKYNDKYKDMNAFLAAPKEEQEMVINAVKRHNLTR